MQIGVDCVGVEVGVCVDFCYCLFKGVLFVVYVKQDFFFFGLGDIWVDGQGFFVYDIGVVGVECVGV